jgi:COMPASS component SWD3
MENNNSPSKRRRLDNGYINSDSSSDELASSDHEIERLRASWSAQKAYASKRYYRMHDLSDSGSPDELAVDADTYWGRNNRQSRSVGHSQSSSQGTATSSSSKLEDTPQRSYNDEELRAQSVEQTPSPPPQPLPKPEWVAYKERFMLKGHSRGVSAVQFSPDGSMIASGGEHGMFTPVWDVI